MSVINQVLLDLEKRRASSAERSVLPSHVRALPESERAVPWRWIGGAVLLGVLGVSWALVAELDWTRQRVATVIAPPPGAEIAIERVVAASAGVTSGSPSTDPGASLRTEAPASRLSFELSDLPPDASAIDVRSPLPAARVVARAETEVPARSDAPAAAVERPSRTTNVPMPGKAPTGKSEIQKEVRQPAPRELADHEYRKATASLHQGRLAESQEGFQAALSLYPGHLGARQALVGLLLDARKLGEAERVLQEGLTIAPTQMGFAMTLARLQLDRGDAAGATATLRKGLEHAQGSADYVAFLAALLQRQGRHEEAIEYFQAALRAGPSAGVWWLGLGVSLQAVNRASDAQEAYRRARATSNLSPELATFAEQRLRQLQ